MPSDRVSREILEILRRGVDDRGIVVWYDPQKAYAVLAEHFELPDTEILRYESGFFRLRERLERFLEFVHEDGSMRPDAEVPPRLVIYIPIDRKQSDFALIEAETAGTLVEPNASSPERDSRLGRIVERVFHGVAPAKAANMARQADEGLLALEELDRMADEAASPVAGALQALFGGASAEEILLQFVSSDLHDARIQGKSALPEILALGESELGWVPDDPSRLTACRAGLRRFLLVCDFLLACSTDQRPEPFAAVVVPERSAHRDLVRHLCQVWRNRVDLQEAYADAARTVQRDAGLGSAELELDGFEACETFPVLEQRWRDWASEKLVAGDTVGPLDTAKKRAQGFWSRMDPATQLGWKVVESTAELIIAAGEIEAMVRQGKWTLEELVDAYTVHAQPWMRLDRLAREMEARHAHWEVAEEGSEVFERLLAHCRDRYFRASALLSEIYATALRGSGLGLGRSIAHSDVFPKFVRPALEKGRKTAFFMVDALRYEMASELVEGLDREFDIHLSTVLGTLPGITPIGMAALLPSASKGLALEQASGGPDIRIEGRSVGNRKARLEALTAQAGVPACVATLAEVLRPAFRRRKEFGAAQLVVVTSQEIDLLGEEGDEEGIRLYLQDVLDKLRRSLRTLSRAGVEQFIIATDHGFLYVPGADPGLKMDPPGGRTAELHPRVWIGEGGSAGDGFFRVSASQLALGGPFDVAFPIGLATFRVRGPVGPYMHGGISASEHVLPVIVLSVKKTVGLVGESKVRLAIAKDVVTNRVFSISAELFGEGMFPDAERRVRFEMTSAQKEVGQAVAAAYGFEDSTREVLLTAERPNVVTLMLAAGPAPSSITVRALDCETQLVLDSLKNLPVQLSI